MKVDGNESRWQGWMTEEAKENQITIPLPPNSCGGIILVHP